MNIEHPPGDFNSDKTGREPGNFADQISRIVSFSPKSSEHPRISGIRKQVDGAGAAPVHSNIVQFPPVLPATAPTRDVFETVRVVDLSRLRLSLKRKRVTLVKNNVPPAPLDTEKLELLALLETFHKDPNNIWPEVVVIRRAQRGDIQTNHAVLAGMIYLGAHLSEDWTEGQEGPRFFVSLREALLDFKRASTSRFEPSMSRY